MRSSGQTGGTLFRRGRTGARIEAKKPGTSICIGMHDAILTPIGHAPTFRRRSYDLPCAVPVDVRNKTHTWASNTNARPNIDWDFVNMETFSCAFMVKLPLSGSAPLPCFPNA